MEWALRELVLTVKFPANAELYIYISAAFGLRRDSQSRYTSLTFQNDINTVFLPFWKNICLQKVYHGERHGHPDMFLDSIYHTE
jgi:hypothetical protein